MPCYHPLQAYLPVGGSASKKVIFDSNRDHGNGIKLPCGRCIGCRLEYSRQWAVRIMHESMLYKYNCFITLTFDDDHLPVGGSLDVNYFQDFMDRFRKRIKRKKFIDKYGFYCKKVRYFHCGEYGELRHRPHYHACLFNFDFPDKKLFKTVKGNKLYTSDLLSELWPFGFCSIGELTFESAAYVARYCVKKVNGKISHDHYMFNLGDVYFDRDSGEILAKKKEYTTMSRRPGIGHDFYVKYKHGIFPNDSIVMRGREMRPPKYYDNLYEQDNLEFSEIIKDRRVDKMKDFAIHTTPDRLESREKVVLAKQALFSKRELE